MPRRRASCGRRHRPRGHGLCLKGLTQWTSCWLAFSFSVLAFWCPPSLIVLHHPRYQVWTGAGVTRMACCKCPRGLGAALPSSRWNSPAPPGVTAPGSLESSQNRVHEKLRAVLRRRLGETPTKAASPFCLVELCLLCKHCSWPGPLL